jgi:hypothetical protein
MKNIMFDFYDSVNDIEFCLRFLVSYIGNIGLDDLSFKNNLIVLSLEEILNINIYNKFYSYSYVIISKFLKILKNDEELIDEFFILKNKYDFRLYNNYIIFEDVRKFFKKLEEKGLKFNNKI